MPSTFKYFQGQTEMLLWQLPSFSRAKEFIRSWGLRIWGNPSLSTLKLLHLFHCTMDFPSLNLIASSQRNLMMKLYPHFSIKETHSERLCNWLKVTELVHDRFRTWTWVPRMGSSSSYPLYYIEYFYMTVGDLLRGASSTDKSKCFIMCMKAYVIPSLKLHFPFLSHLVTTGET